jgi:hypothetical protein
VCPTRDGGSVPEGRRRRVKMRTMNAHYGSVSSRFRRFVNCWHTPGSGRQLERLHPIPFLRDAGGPQMSLLRGLRVWRSLLGGGVVCLHPSECLFHFAEDPIASGGLARNFVGTHRCRDNHPSAAAVTQRHPSELRLPGLPEQDAKSWL